MTVKGLALGVHHMRDVIGYPLKAQTWRGAVDFQPHRTPRDPKQNQKVTQMLPTGVAMTDMKMVANSVASAFANGRLAERQRCAEIVRQHRRINERKSLAPVDEVCDAILAEIERGEQEGE